MWVTSLRMVPSAHRDQPLVLQDPRWRPRAVATCPGPRGTSEAANWHCYHVTRSYERSNDATVYARWRPSQVGWSPSLRTEQEATSRAPPPRCWGNAMRGQCGGNAGDGELKLLVERRRWKRLFFQRNTIHIAMVHVSFGSSLELCCYSSVLPT